MNSNVDIKTLMKHSGELYMLINETNSSLNVPVSRAAEAVKADISHLTPKMASMLSKAVQSGNFEEIIVGGAVIGVAWLGANVYDFARNTYAQQKAKAALLGYYQELAVKQSLIIQEMKKLSEEYQACAAQNEQKAAELKARCDALEKVADKISAFILKTQKA